MREALFNKLAYKVVTMGCGADVCSVLPVETEDWQVEDPSGKSLERFREIREETKRRVERLIEELGFR
jgi:arsenate reductase